MTKQIKSKYQLEIERVYNTTNSNLFINASAGCFSRGTKILSFDGTSKKVEDICVGDKLMGSDSNSRNVQELCRGRELMYEIVPTKGESFICNKNHVLSLYSYLKKGIVDISVDELLKSKEIQHPNGAYRNLKLIRFGVSLPKKELKYDPYFIGLWLGDGNKSYDNCNHITVYSKDIETLEYLKSFSELNGFIPKQSHKGRNNCFRVSFSKHISGELVNPLTNYLRKFIQGGLHIEENYLLSDREDRLNLLAGLLDSDGHYSKGYFEITVKQKQLAENIMDLSRSLGFAAYLKEKTGTIASLNFKGIYWRISISGNVNEIPTRIARKIAKPRKQIKDVLRTGFTIVEKEEEDYFGFRVDGDNRFLLGDYTLTHNSGKTTVLKALSSLTPPTKKIIFLAFNKSVQEELRSKLPPHVEVSTLHAKGYGILRSNVKMNVKLNELKNFIYCRQVIKRKFKDKKAENGYFFEVSSIINFMKIKNLTINKENIKKICENYGLSDDEKIVSDTENVMIFIQREEQDLNQTKPLNIDFTDMLYLCAKK